MMAYVEWLRVRKVLRLFAIALGAFFLLACIGRLIPTINNPNVHIQVSGSVSGFGGQIDVTAFAVIAFIGGMIVASFLGGPLGKENEQLAIAWTKPIDRSQLALRLFGVDAIGIIAGMLLAIVLAKACLLLFIPAATFVWMGSWTLIAISLLLPFAWYAFITVTTTSVKRRAGGFVAFLYVGAFILPGIAAIQFGDSAVGTIVHDVLAFLAFFDPITYMQLSANGADSGPFVAGKTTSVEILLGLTVLYLGASLVQWRRLEV